MTDRQLVALAALTKVLEEWEAEMRHDFYDSQYRRGVLDIIHDIRHVLDLPDPTRAEDA